MRRLLVIALVLAAGACAQPVDPGAAEVARALSSQVDADRLMNDVVALSQEHWEDTPFDCASLDATSDTWCRLTNVRSRAWLAARFTELGLEVTDDVSLEHPPTHNLFVEVKGTERPEEVLLVGAHFDAFYGGADDNSSGVAVMVEMARLIAQAPLRRTVRFVGFDLEEIGLVGSSRMARSKSPPLVSLVFDCVGYRDTAAGSQKSLPGLPNSPAGDFLAVIGNEVSRPRIETLLEVARGDPAVPPLQALLAPGLGAGPLTGNLMRSDHAPFWLEGQSAVFFTDTANFRNPNYHTPQDEPATLDREFLASVARAALLAVGTWGNGP